MEFDGRPAPRSQEHLGQTGSLRTQPEFRIHRLEMQRLSQKQGESVEDFYIRIKMQALKCKYASEDITQERILE